MHRMSDKQYKDACALIRSLCCNYDRPTGGCLLLDVPCPQILTQSLVCRYFRDVLLEDREGKALKAEIMGPEAVKTCEACGQPFRAVSNRAKYCASCAGRMKRIKATQRKRKQRDTCHALEQKKPL
jgi:hypothetical protein